jgi:hypothetical protein
MKKKGLVGGLGASILAITIFCGAPSARAATVSVDAAHDYQDVGFIIGTQGITNAFDVALAGTYEATLTDFSFPDAFQAVQLIVTSATHELNRITGPGHFLFDAAPGRYYVSLMGRAGNDFELSLYGVRIAAAGEPPAPVPIPGASWLMISSIALLSFLGWRRRVREQGLAAA